MYIDNISSVGRVAQNPVCLAEADIREVIAVILKRLVGVGAVVGILGFSVVGFAGAANAYGGGGGGNGGGGSGGGSSSSSDDSDWPPKSDMSWPPKGGADNNGGSGGGGNNGGGHNSGAGGGGDSSDTPIVMPDGQPAPTKTAAPKTNASSSDSSDSSDESKPIVPVNAPPLDKKTPPAPAKPIVPAAQ